MWIVIVGYIISILRPSHLLNIRVDGGQRYTWVYVVLYCRRSPQNYLKPSTVFIFWQPSLHRDAITIIGNCVPFFLLLLWFCAGYGEEKPAIVKKKRRRKKKGKKHKPFKVKDFKKLKKFMLPLLLAYKLKFFTLVPLMLGGLVLIVATTGFAGFFFALFAVGLGLKGHHWWFSDQMVFIILLCELYTH